MLPACTVHRPCTFNTCTAHSYNHIRQVFRPCIPRCTSTGNLLSYKVLFYTTCCVFKYDYQNAAHLKNVCYCRNQPNTTTHVQNIYTEYIHHVHTGTLNTQVTCHLQWSPSRCTWHACLIDIITGIEAVHVCIASSCNHHRSRTDFEKLFYFCWSITIAFYG